MRLKPPAHRSRRVPRLAAMGALALGIAAAGCPAKSPETSPAEPAVTAPLPDDVRIGSTQEPDTLFHPFMELMSSWEIAYASPFTLTVFNADWTIVPHVAVEIPTVANGGVVLSEHEGATRMTVTWRLKPDFTWDDGTPLSADDFVAAWELAKDPRQPMRGRSEAEYILSMVSADDGRTLVVTWKEPYAYYDAFRVHEAVPAHVIRPLLEAGQSLQEHPYGRKPLLAGPFAFKEWVAASHVTLARRPSKASEGPGAQAGRVDTLSWRFVARSDALETHLVSGEIDVISPWSLSLDQAEAIAKRHSDKFRVEYVEGLGWEHLDFNLGHPALKDVRVRKALAHGIDLDALVRAAVGERQKAAVSPIPRRSGMSASGLKVHAHDVERANQLLDEAGWTRGEDGARRRGDTPLSIDLVTTSGNASRQKLQALLQAEWKKLGVDVKLRAEPPKVFFGQTLPRRGFTGIAMYAIGMSPRELADAIWRCDMVPTEANGFQGRNLTGWCDPEADALLARIGRELDDKRRVALVQEFEARWLTAIPSLPLYFKVEPLVIRRGLEGPRPHGTLQPFTWNASTWRWTKARQ